jgi:hypothetical protein
MKGIKQNKLIFTEILSNYLLNKKRESIFNFNKRIFVSSKKFKALKLFNRYSC